MSSSWLKMLSIPGDRHTCISLELRLCDEMLLGCCRASPQLAYRMFPVLFGGAWHEGHFQKELRWLGAGISEGLVANIAWIFPHSLGKEINSCNCGALLGMFLSYRIHGTALFCWLLCSFSPASTGVAFKSISSLPLW